MDSITVAQLATDHQTRTRELADLAQHLLSDPHRDPEMVLQLQIAALEQGAEMIWALQAALAVQEKIEARRQGRLHTRFWRWASRSLRRRIQ